MNILDKAIKICTQDYQIYKSGDVITYEQAKSGMKIDTGAGIIDVLNVKSRATEIMISTKQKGIINVDREDGNEVFGKLV